MRKPQRRAQPAKKEPNAFSVRVTAGAYRKAQEIARLNPYNPSIAGAIARGIDLAHEEVLRLYPNKEV